MTKYLSCAETAKLIRKELKSKFPNNKFTVRSSTYAGGASIRVGWIDGPAQSQVNELTNGFEGAGFDGMVDYKFYKKHWMMPDGSIAKAKSEGSACTGGYTQGYDNPKPHPDAEMISMGADYIFTERDISECHKVEAANELLQQWTHDFDGEITEENYSDVAHTINLGCDWLTTKVYQKLNKISFQQ